MKYYGSQDNEKDLMTKDSCYSHCLRRVITDTEEENGYFTINGRKSIFPNTMLMFVNGALNNGNYEQAVEGNDLRITMDVNDGDEVIIVW